MNTDRCSSVFICGCSFSSRAARCQECEVPPARRSFHVDHNREGRVDSGGGICVSSGFCRRISIMDWKELEKMTIVKIREEALKHEIKSVHGKSKAQLMDRSEERRVGTEGEIW